MDRDASLELTFSAIRAEVARQRALKEMGKFDHTPSDADCPNPLRFAILGEEVGEVAKALMERGFDEDESELEIELVQVAAVCVAWIEGLHA